MGTAERLKMSYAEYAKREEIGEVKHQFLNGEVFAMAGGTREHGALAAAVMAALGAAAGPCRAFSSDTRVRTPSGLSTYPDITVVCGKVEGPADDPCTVSNPTLVVEILSESTESFDRGEKFKHYRSLPSLREYVLVSFREPLIESHARNADGSWVETFASAGESLALRSMSARLEVDAIYSGLARDEEQGRMRLA